uniref:NADH dehydrogenase subunit 3 n=1 Tax=Caulophacus iocasicus TaxID=3031190 RepID=UPI0023F26AE1|nr:NADH dehydrogenase subunit 3 [Caulophacus iocasicus]WDY83511.1 NADH dehydrogenase subunit 3 [Caulophacus iocasicus]
MQLEEYIPIIILLIIRTSFATILLTISTLIRKNNLEAEKISIYECGFDPLKTPRLPFSIKFFLIGVLFLIFDLEISYIFPWATTTKEMKWIRFITIILFLTILTLGFIYEWIKEGLEWE